MSSMGEKRRKDFISQILSPTQEDTISETWLFEKCPDNWLHRNSLHLSVMLLYSEALLKHIPEHIIEKYIAEEDVHGCTPLHVAHLHNNTVGVQFLIANGAKTGVVDKFGVQPHELGSRIGVTNNKRSSTVQYVQHSSPTQDHPDVLYYKLCSDVTKSKSNILGKLKRMIVLSEDEAERLHKELLLLFKRLVENTEFQTAKIVLAGSLREKLKTGRLDEADVQLQFDQKYTVTEPEGQFAMRYPVTEPKMQFAMRLSNHLTHQISKISWMGILRPVSLKGPWKFIRQGDGPCKGMPIDVDVVCVILHEKEKSHIHDIQKTILDGDTMHKMAEYIVLQTWKDNEERQFRETIFRYEWAILDSSPTQYRLGIAMAKSLVQASIHYFIFDLIYVNVIITD
jgi:hypothetical protein